jgi:hypothetical protein
VVQCFAFLTCDSAVSTYLLVKIADHITDISIPVG